MSLDEFNMVGKILFYVPCYLNNILTQIWYFILFPIIYLNFLFVNKFSGIDTLMNIYLIKNSYKNKI